MIQDWGIAQITSKSLVYLRPPLFTRPERQKFTKWLRDEMTWVSCTYGLHSFFYLASDQAVWPARLLASGGAVSACQISGQELGGSGSKDTCHVSE